ncbi:MAG: hypothetical protein M3N30_13595 [Bacteroidota bacterium]|nr:hypothetical protein [Bacteroidota bacterium]
MQTQIPNLRSNLTSEICLLEIQKRYYENLLDQSIRNDEVFAKTRIIVVEIKVISQRLAEIQKIAIAI